MGGVDSISILQTGFIICLAFAIVFFIISVVLFFVFNIRLIFNIRTGRAKKKTIEEMQKANSETGRLRAKGKSLTSKLGSDTPPESQFSGFQKNYTSSSGSGSETTSSLENVMENTSYSVNVPSYKYANENESEFAETSLLNEADISSETTLLSDENDSTGFKILQRMIFIHTDEIIC